MNNYFKYFKQNTLYEDVRTSKIYCIYETKWTMPFCEPIGLFERFLSIFGIYPCVIVFEPNTKNNGELYLIPVNRYDFCKYMKIVNYE